MLSSFFKKPESAAKLKKALANDLAAAERRRDRLIEQLTAAEVIVSAREVAARDAALSGAGDDILATAAIEIQTAAAKEIQTARELVKTFADALAVADREVADVRDRLAQANDRAMRDETVTKVADMSKAVERAGIEIEAAHARVAEAMAAVSVIVPEARGVQYFCEGAQVELAEAFANVQKLLKSHSRGVAEGHLPAAIPGQEVPAPKPKPALVEMMTVFPIENLKWSEGGAVHTTPRYYAITLPRDLGERAIARKLADLTDSPRAKRLQQLGSARIVHPDDCFSLDGDVDGAAKTSSPQTPSGTAFEPLDRGAPTTGTITISRVA